MRRYLLTALGVMAMLVGMTAGVLAQDDVVEESYRATLQPMNPDIVGSETTGTVLITFAGDKVTFQAEMQGAPPDVAHWQHIHGFAMGEQASSCPADDADANDDGIIDLIETEESAGTTMIPLNDDPVAFDIPADTYPVADENGTYTYEATVEKDELEDAFSEHFPDADGLNFENRVVFVHGVADDTELPDSVQSLGEIPATTTLPIACGELDAADSGTPIATPASPVPDDQG